MIVGEKVTLRALNLEDSKIILRWVNNPNLKHLTGTVYPVSDIEHDSWYKAKINDSRDKVFGIQFNQNNMLLGVIGFKNIDYINRNAELYVYIGEEDYWGKGIGSEAISMLIKFSFEELNFHRVYLSVFSYNTRAIKSYEKVGFKVEGILKESVFRQGKYHDKNLMAIINETRS